MEKPESLSNNAENSSFDTEFARQYANREYYEVAGGNAEVIDVRPEKIKDEVPVIFIPGWGCDLTVYEPALKTLTSQERRVVSFNQPRKGGDLSEHATEEELKKYPAAQLRNSLNILGIMEQKNIEKADVIAHSQGALNTVIAAILHPERFRNIVLFAPAGLIGEDTFTRLVKGFAAQNKRADSLSEMPISDTEKRVGKAALDSVLSYIASNPLRALKETLEMPKSQIHEMIRFLHDQGIGIVVMSGMDDPVFPMYRMQEIAKMDMIDGFVSMRGGHGTIGDRPEEYMVQAERMLSALKSQGERMADGKRPDLSNEFI